MKKRTLIILLTVLFILFISTISFADDLKNDIHNTTDMIVDGVSSTAEKARNGVGAIENTVEDGAKDVGNTITEGASDVSNVSYDVTRTDANGQISNISSTFTSSWAWIIIAAAIFVIIGVIWSYVSQDNHHE